MVEESLIDETTAVRDRLTAGRLDELFKKIIKRELKESAEADRQGP